MLLNLALAVLPAAIYAHGMKQKHRYSKLLIWESKHQVEAAMKPIKPMAALMLLLIILTMRQA